MSYIVTHIANLIKKSQTCNLFRVGKVCMFPVIYAHFPGLFGYYDRFIGESVHIPGKYAHFPGAGRGERMKIFVVLRTGLRLMGKTGKR